MLVVALLPVEAGAELAVFCGAVVVVVVTVVAGWLLLAGVAVACVAVADVVDRDVDAVLAVRLVPPFLVSDATDTVGATVVLARAAVVLVPAVVPLVPDALDAGLDTAPAADLFAVSMSLAAPTDSLLLAGAALAVLSPDPQAARLAAKIEHNRVRLKGVVRSIMGV